MESRLNYFGNPLAGKILKHINSANKVVSDSALIHGGAASTCS
ncbi:hypothetical protein [Streptomyces sp. 2A115]